ncbi:pyridoxal-phosphate dependent enzyme [Stackebrandtia albiflava]|uniref:pyridoxal-phosphate dependent enzyme n=1 Tax=Stackebrandtia albiflava TaxID=406432 RepID=UPI0011BE698C
MTPRIPSPVVELDDERLRRHGVRLWLKRDDLIHPDLPGNKWRKLVGNLRRAADEGHRTLLTFGGAYSHHIAATAAAGRLLGIDTVGVIRGEAHRPLNPVLGRAAADGMTLTYLDRERYRRKHLPEVLDPLRERFGDFHHVPEGGSNDLGVRGCRDLGAEIAAQLPGTDLVCVPVGSGGTIAGVAAGVPPSWRVLGVSVLRGDGFLDPEVTRLQREAFGGRRGDWSIDYRHHFGGYARRTPELDGFMADFRARHGIRLEPVYVAKSLAAVYGTAGSPLVPAGSRVVAVVTGPPPWW